MVGQIEGYIPTLTVGEYRYTHYPLRVIPREETEALLRDPSLRHTILLRVSHHARQENPATYYVLSYIPPDHEDPVHVIITHSVHAEHHSNLAQILPHPIENHRLLLLPHHVGYAQTVREQVNVLPAASRS